MDASVEGYMPGSGGKSRARRPRKMSDEHMMIAISAEGFLSLEAIWNTLRLDAKTQL